MPTRKDDTLLREKDGASAAGKARIMLGSGIRVRDLDQDRVMEFALVGRTRGERVAIEVPRGSLRLEVLEVL